MSESSIRKINCFEDFFLNQLDYEEQLFWIASVSVFIEDEYSKVKKAENRHFDDDTYRKSLRLVEECAFALGSQSERWRDASARLSSDSRDFGVFEMRRATDTIRIPEMFSKLKSMVLSTFGNCPEFPQSVQAPFSKKL